MINLLQICDAATQGEWSTKPSAPSMVYSGKVPLLAAGKGGEANAQFIATFNPGLCRKLVELVMEAECPNDDCYDGMLPVQVEPDGDIDFQPCPFCTRRDEIGSDV